MLNAYGRTADGRPLLMLGLLRANMDRLRAGQPIYIEAEAPAYGLPPIQVMMCAGNNELDILDGLRSNGLVPPCCDMHNQHCEPPSELCCEQCTEARHPNHAAGVRCVLDPLPGAPRGTN